MRLLSRIMFIAQKNTDRTIVLSSDTHTLALCK